jgi:hypothetical protein
VAVCRLAHRAVSLPGKPNNSAQLNQLKEIHMTIRHQLMYLMPMTDSTYTDTMDDTPFVFEIEAKDNPLDADDPETALHDYLNTIFRATP